MTTLGHVQRGGTPTATDRILATRYGIKAADLVHERKFGHMAALHGSEMTSVPLSEVEGLKTVDLGLPADRADLLRVAGLTPPAPTAPAPGSRRTADLAVLEAEQVEEARRRVAGGVHVDRSRGALVVDVVAVMRAR